jgi:uncharacterized 2Fe-2S/4Fe-4S cluster protein (DUF4445 family)
MKESQRRTAGADFLFERKTSCPGTPGREENRSMFSIVELKLTPPSLKNNTADLERFIEALSAFAAGRPVDTDLPMMKQLSAKIREGDFHLRCVLAETDGRLRVAGIRSAAAETPFCGLAIDLGTSRIVCRLIQMASGEILAESAITNPQTRVGPDVLTRIHHAADPAGLATLQSLVIHAVNEEIERITESCGLATTDVCAMALAGNTAMTHLFLGLDPKWMIREPYIPVVNRPGWFPAATLGLKVDPLACLFVFPNVGSYFGGDLISGILSCGLHQRDEPAILVDVGTNAEVVLGDRNWLIACAGAAGPALEGGVTQMGMMAGPGVIETVEIDPETLEIGFRTIDDQPPVGICGSGLIDLAAQLFRNKMLDIRGKFVPEICGPRIIDIDEVPHLIVVPESRSATGRNLSISQADLDSLVRSKAAMYTILETITASVGISLRDIGDFFVAGTFGAYIRPESAIGIGMLPDLPRETYQSIGNSSLAGATKVLTGNAEMAEIDVIRNRITYMELNVNQDFMNRFSAAKFIPHTDKTLFPSCHPHARKESTNA